jgi:hypothetical protein
LSRVGAIKADPGTDPKYTALVQQVQSDMTRGMGPSKGRKTDRFHELEAASLRQFGLPYLAGQKSVVRADARTCTAEPNRLCCPDAKTVLTQGCGPLQTEGGSKKEPGHSRWFEVPSAWAAVEFVGREFLEGVVPEKSVGRLLEDLVKLGRLDKPSTDLGGLKSLKEASRSSGGLFGLSGKMELTPADHGQFLVQLQAPPREGQFRMRVQTDEKFLCEQLTQVLPRARSNSEKQLVEACESRGRGRPVMVGLGPDPERIVFILGTFADVTRVYMRGPTQLSLDEALWLSRLGAVAEEAEIPEI